MRIPISIILAGLLVSLAIFLNGFFERRAHQEKIEGCVKFYSENNRFPNISEEFFILKCEKEID